MFNLRQRIKDLFAQLFLMDNQQTEKSKRLYEVTMSNIGKDLSPIEDKFACAETVYTLLHLAFGDTYKTRSTREAYDHMMISPYYARVQSPLPGDIVISATGYGNGNISNGHMGIVLDDGKIASNNSYNSKLEINYNLESWKQRYGVIGGFPIAYYRRLT